jgi:hypothetical protein
MENIVAEVKYDPSKLFVSTRLIRDESNGGVIVDEDGKWVSGKLYIQLFDNKSGYLVASKDLQVSRKKYDAFREDFDPLSTEDVIKEHFPNVETDTASESELQEAARKSKEESEARADAAAKAAEEAVGENDEKRDGVTEEADEVTVTNVRPVGDPGVEVSNPEQEFSNEEMIEKGADAVGSGEKDAQNPEQSATNVPEDEFKKKGKEEKASVTNTRTANVVPEKE